MDEARLGGGGEIPRFVFMDVFGSRGIAFAVTEGDGSTSSICVAVPSETVFAFFAEAGLGGGGEVPRFAFLDRVLKGAEVDGGPRNVGAALSACTTEA